MVVYLVFVEKACKGTPPVVIVVLSPLLKKGSQQTTLVHISIIDQSISTMSANDDATARIKDLKNQLELVDATITMPSTDPAHWASIKDLPEFETLRLKSEIDLYKLKIKLMDEIHQLEINRKDEIHQMKMLHFEFLVYNTPSMDPVTANATGRKKGELFKIDRALI